jgi:hypothetical protein
LRKNSALVTNYVRKLCGASQPILARASDGFVYVVKFASNLQDASAPFKESVGSELFRACGLSVPAWKPLLITDSFLDRNPDCWTLTPEGYRRPEPGLCFGSRFLGGDDIRLFQILPGSGYQRIRNRVGFWLAWLIDICAGRGEHRQAVFVEDAEGFLGASFVDHRHFLRCLKADREPDSFLASPYIDSRIYPDVSEGELLSFQRTVLSLDSDRLWQKAQALPAEWKAASALNCMEHCLQRLSNESLVRNVIDMMTVSPSCINGSAFNVPHRRRKPPASVLRAGIQSAGPAHRRVIG